MWRSFLLVMTTACGHARVQRALARDDLEAATCAMEDVGAGFPRWTGWRANERAAWEEAIARQPQGTLRLEVVDDVELEGFLGRPVARDADGRPLYVAVRAHLEGPGLVDRVELDAIRLAGDVARPASPHDREAWAQVLGETFAPGRMTTRHAAGSDVAAVASTVLLTIPTLGLLPPMSGRSEERWSPGVPLSPETEAWMEAFWPRLSVGASREQPALWVVPRPEPSSVDPPAGADGLWLSVHYTSPCGVHPLSRARVALPASDEDSWREAIDGLAISLDGRVEVLAEQWPMGVATWDGPEWEGALD